MIDEKYQELRSMIKQDYAIKMKDGRRPEVTIILDDFHSRRPYVSYIGKTIEDALERAIIHLKNPSKNYIDINGNKWETNDSSIYNEHHLRTFLSIESDIKRSEKDA